MIDMQSSERAMAQNVTSPDADIAVDIDIAETAETAVDRGSDSASSAPQAEPAVDSVSSAPQAEPAVDSVSSASRQSRDVADRWSRIAFSVEPVNRAAAGNAVSALYEIATGSEPREIIWCASPAEAARLVANGDQRLFGASLREKLRTEPWQRARAQLLDQLGREAWTAAWRETCAELAPTVSRLAEQIADAVVEQTEDQADDQAKDQAADQAERTKLRLALTFADLGQHNASWLPLFERCFRPDDERRLPDVEHHLRSDDAADDAAGPTSAAAELTDRPVLEALAAVAEQVHWWWAFENVAILCERPTQLHLDERGRLHNGDGPALAYADGFALHRWRGVAIPAEFAQTLATLTPDAIRAERNAELRRIMLEHYGTERYIVDSGAEPVQQDAAGKLWRVSLPGDEPIVMVEVVNSTAEPDGSFNTYWLRVPPNTRTAKAAVAWTFGLSEEEYEPEVQT